jgi:hypothetical protein
MVYITCLAGFEEQNVDEYGNVIFTFPEDSARQPETCKMRCGQPIEDSAKGLASNYSFLNSARVPPDLLDQGNEASLRMNIVLALSLDHIAWDGKCGDCAGRSAAQYLPAASSSGQDNYQ